MPTTTSQVRPVSRRAVLPALLAGLVVGLLTGVLVAGATGGGEDEPEPGSVEAIAAELAQGQAEESAALAAELAVAAEQAHATAGSVLRGLAEVAPPDGGAAGDVPADPDAWSADLEQAREALLATGEGSDDHGVTRAALVGSLELLAVAVEDARVLTGPGTEQEQVLADLDRDREAAVRLWQAGAARLDSLVVAAGGEHVHLFLAPDGDPASVPQEFQQLHED